MLADCASVSHITQRVTQSTPEIVNDALKSRISCCLEDLREICTSKFNVSTRASAYSTRKNDFNSRIASQYLTLIAARSAGVCSGAFVFLGPPIESRHTYIERERVRSFKCSQAMLKGRGSSTRRLLNHVTSEAAPLGKTSAR